MLFITEISKHVNDNFPFEAAFSR